MNNNKNGTRVTSLIPRLILLVSLILAPAVALASDHHRSILMITWRGMTPAEHSFIAHLETLGIEADIELFDAGRDQTRLAGFLRDRLNDIKSMDLIYTFGTTVTLTVQNFHFDNVPRVFNIVTDPVGVGLAPSLERPPPGMTGTKHSLSPDVNLELLFDVYPVRTIAVLFDPREHNAVAEADRLSSAAEERGISVKRLRFAPDAKEKEIQIAALRPELDDVDAIYVTSSSSFVAHSEALPQIIPEDLVSIGSSSAYVGDGITLVFGSEYEERGRTAAEMAAKILLQNVPPHSLPIDELSASEATLYINGDNKAASKLKLEKARNAVVYK
ncbi:MAG: ABC transporter substrate binding protein [Pseudomonadota bacterium]